MFKLLTYASKKIKSKGSTNRIMHNKCHCLKLNKNQATNLLPLIYLQYLNHKK
jgi:hypothetical protein